MFQIASENHPYTDDGAYTYIHYMDYHNNNNLFLYILIYVIPDSVTDNHAKIDFTDKN